MNRLVFVIFMITINLNGVFHAQSQLNSLQFKNNLTYFEGNVNKLDVLSQINYDIQDSISELSNSYRIFYGELNFKKKQFRTSSDYKLRLSL